MRSLLLIAHGSRRSASNDEVRMLATQLGYMSQRYDTVEAAFLELAEPSIPDAIEQCIQQGATAVTILPYFLSAGRHVVKDIPHEVQEKIDTYPEIDIVIAPYLGSAEQIVDVLLNLAEGSESYYE
jgi:sirohydrochlorin ferrochelatase